MVTLLQTLAQLTEQLGTAATLAMWAYALLTVLRACRGLGACAIRPPPCTPPLSSASKPLSEDLGSLFFPIV